MVQGKTAKVLSFKPFVLHGTQSHTCQQFNNVVDYMIILHKENLGVKKIPAAIYGFREVLNT